jgi:uncharacterized protein (DUF58 family)
MYFPKDEGISKFEFSVYAAASLIELLKKQRDAVGLSLISDKIELHTQAKSSIVHHRFLYAELEKRMISYDPNLKKTTNIVQSLHDIAELTHRRSLIIVFSDLLDDPDKVDELFRALEHMRHNKHEVILFHVVDGKKEIDFELGNSPFNLVDMETGERMKIRPAEVKESYKKAVNTYFEELKMRSINNRIDFMPADIHEGYNQILLQYFLKRQKMY